MWICSFCNKEYPDSKSELRHKRSCGQHPNRLKSNYKEKLSLSAKLLWASGKIKGVPHTQEAKDKIAAGARKSKHRRLLKSCRQYKTISGKIVLLDSSWEESLAKRLDELQIDWVRPDIPLEWIDSQGKIRNYFPDFWLPKQKIYLDPKNPEAIKQQSEKLQWLSKNRNDIIILKSLLECKNYTTSDGTP